ncbi:MAG: methyltransferase domain-containing protein [Fluviibacter sp.]
MNQLNPQFWQERFDSGTTNWDRGGCSPQLLEWLSNDEIPKGHIAVPGCGKGWEVAELARQGFDVTAIDYTQGAVIATRNLLDQNHLQAEVIHADVLTYQPSSLFDAVYEQTCLCALEPDHWIAYAQQLARWINPRGHLYALFMQVERPGAKDGLVQGPPFHCDINAMHALFNNQYWIWPDLTPTRVNHPNGLHELAVTITRNDRSI